MVVEWLLCGGSRCRNAGPRAQQPTCPFCGRECCTHCNGHTLVRGRGDIDASSESLEDSRGLQIMIRYAAGEIRVGVDTCMNNFGISRATFKLVLSLCKQETGTYLVSSPARV